MLEPDGVALGVAAARRLAELGRTVIRPGLTDREFDQIEQRYGFQFADDHRAFLAEGLPIWNEGDDDPNNTIDLGWPDWRDGHPEQLRAHLDFALEGALAKIKNGYWHPWWGDDRPTDVADALRVALERLTADGPLVPLYVHRFLPAGRGRWGHPVLSIWDVDIIYYGADLLDYIDREFDIDDDPDAEPKPWPDARTLYPTTFWVQIADWSRNGRPIPPPV